MTIHVLIEFQGQSYRLLLKVLSVIYGVYEEFLPAFADLHEFFTFHVPISRPNYGVWDALFPFLKNVLNGDSAKAVEGIGLDPPWSESAFPHPHRMHLHGGQNSELVDCDASSF